MKISLLFALFLLTKTCHSTENYYIKLSAQQIELGQYEANFRKKALQTWAYSDRGAAEALTHLAIGTDENVLFYIHSLWGNAPFYHKNSLQKLNSLESFHKVVAIEWHTGFRGYSGAYKQSFHLGKQSSGFLLDFLSKAGGTHFLLCHSMGHRFFEGIFVGEKTRQIPNRPDYREKDRGEPNSRPHLHFKAIFFAASDSDMDVFWGNFNELPNTTDCLVILTHDHDRWLWVSRLVHQKTRLGRLPAAEIARLRIFPQISVVNITGLRPPMSFDVSNHTYFKRVPAVLGMLGE